MRTSQILSRVPKVTKTKIGKDEQDKVFPVKHYSHSSMVRFSTNPILFKIQDINGDRLETTMGISGILGKAFHLALEVYYGGNDQIVISSEAEAIEMGLKTGMEFIKNYNDGFIEWNTAIVNKDKAYEVFAFAFNSYIKEKPYQTDGEELVTCEEQIKEKIDVEWRGKQLSLPVPLKGYLDKLIRHERRLKIKDYKLVGAFSDPEKIDGAKILQAINYYLLTYAHYGEEPYSITFEEIKRTKNKDGGKQVREYEIVYSENELFFDFYFRFYEDMTRALNGEMVYVPNINAFYDNEVALISYIHRLDVTEEQAKLMKKYKVDNITDLLKKKIHSAGNMRKLLKTIEQKFVSAKTLNYNKMITEEKIQTKMLEHGMMLQFDSKIEGATVDMYRYTPSIGLKMKKLMNYVEDIEQVLGISGIRILAPIPNTSLIGYEIPKKDRTFPELPGMKNGFKLAIGQTINGDIKTFDIREAPHMLVAGSTGSGKSVFLHSLIRQLIKLPNVDLHLFDPKQIELSQYEEDVKEYKHSHAGILASIEKLVEEMEARYDIMKQKKVKTIADMKGMPYKFVVIDEYADLKMRSSVDRLIQLLAQKGRACGIHMIIATQRASTKIIDGDVKINFPTKVVFRVSKGVDSRVMIDEDGAEKLLGKGDMLFCTDAGIERLQGYFVK